MKVLAMYLPQFHKVPENDLWWGYGYTEWDAVRRAIPLFKGHEQPKIPLNYNYYNLLEKKTMEWQAKLMHQYQIDGFCFYHYYFEKGKKILELPAENLLKWKDISIPFCFSWANESWIKSWSNLTTKDGNVWIDDYNGEKTNKGNKQDQAGVLLKQEYGDKEEWEAHYRYLSDFFKDERYIKKENAPVFLIYKPADIKCLKEMIALWDELARLDGFSGIYIISQDQMVKDKSIGISDYFEPEPKKSLEILSGNKFENEYGVLSYVEYKDILDLSASHQYEKGKSIGTFVGYDDSPRRGKCSKIVGHCNPEDFAKYMKIMHIKAKKNMSDFLFINAWNEWGEGMYLEPDEKYKYAFLDAIKDAHFYAEGQSDLAELGIDNTTDVLNKEICNLKVSIQRQREYWMILDQWMVAIEKGIVQDQYLIDNGFQTIAIYGMGMLGKHLFNQLQDKKIKIAYLIDCNKIQVSHNIHTYVIEDNLPDCDLIIVTVMYNFDQIKNKLQKKTNARIMSLNEYIENLLQ